MKRQKRDCSPLPLGRARIRFESWNKGLQTGHLHRRSLDSEARHQSTLAAELLPSEVEGGSAPGLPPSFWQVLAVFGVPWLEESSHQSLLSCSCSFSPIRVRFCVPVYRL